MYKEILRLIFYENISITIFLDKHIIIILVLYKTSEVCKLEKLNKLIFFTINYYFTLKKRSFIVIKATP